MHALPKPPRTTPSDPRPSRSRHHAVAALPAPERSRRHLLFFAAAALLLVAAILALPIATGARPHGAHATSSPLPTRTASAPAAVSPNLVSPGPVSPGPVSPGPVPPAPGFWHTSGSRILDARGNPVRIAGLNWSGFETTAAVPGGLRRQDYRTILRSIAGSGYNTVRLPFSNQMVEHPAVPTEIAFLSPNGPINTDLSGLNSLEIMDRIVAAAGRLGLRVILDNHRSEAGSSAEANGLWYTADYPEEQWLADWTRLAVRYRNNPTVIGFDLRNEPHNAGNGGSCWDCGGPTDWHLAAERAGNRILRVNPAALIFVEGTDGYNGESYWWGGDLAGVRTSPIRLAVPNRLVYSAHVYGPAEFQQPWFNDRTTPSSLVALWRDHWAFLVEDNVAPVWIGEFGTTNDDAAISSFEPGSEGQWFQTLVSFLAAHRSIGWTYWGANGEDRYALLDSNYSLREANAAKLNALARIQLAEAPLSTVATVPAASEPAESPEAQATSQLPKQRNPARPNHVKNPVPAVDDTIAEQVRLATARALQNLGD